MKPDDRWRERIDACRPGGDDLASPEMRDLAEACADDERLADLLRQSQAWDREIQATMHDVEVPAELSNRLLTRLAEAASCEVLLSEDLLADQPPPASSDTATPASTDHRPGLAGRFLRRRVLVSAMLLTVTCCLAAFFLWPRPANLPLDERGLAEFVVQQGLSDAAWNPLPAPTPPTKMVPGRLTSWQRVVDTTGRSVTVFRFQLGSKTAYLASLERPLPPTPLPTSFPSQSTTLTGGYLYGAAYLNGQLYVLIVRGQENDYQTFAPPRQFT